MVASKKLHINSNLKTYLTYFLLKSAPIASICNMCISLHNCIFKYLPQVQEQAFGHYKFLQKNPSLKE